MINGLAHHHVVVTDNAHKLKLSVDMHNFLLHLLLEVGVLGVVNDAFFQLKLIVDSFLWFLLLVLLELESVEARVADFTHTDGDITLAPVALVESLVWAGLLVGL